MESSHKLKGQHVYDGMTLLDAVQVSTIERLKLIDLDGDVLIASYPKTGTTWVQEMTWLILHNGDIDAALQEPLDIRSPFAEMDSMEGSSQIGMIEEMQRPRLIKTHLPARIFARQLQKNRVKVVVVVRNPKDTLVSLFHFYRANASLGSFCGTWNEYFRLYETKGLVYGDFFDWYLDWWRYQGKADILFVKYEDMQANLPVELRRIAGFVGKDLSNDVVERIARHGKFETMKDNQMVNMSNIPKEFLDQTVSPFMRKGHIGDWKNHFTEAQSRQIDEEYEKRFKSIGIELAFEQNGEGSDTKGGGDKEITVTAL